MILEPMATSTEHHRERQEKAKLKAGLKGRRGASAGQKRKHDDEEEGSTRGQENESIVGQSPGDAKPQKKKRTKGPKAPNPLSVKKPKKSQAPPPEPHRKTAARATTTETEASHISVTGAPETSVPEGDGSGMRKRKRKHKPRGDGGASVRTEADTAVS